MTDAASPPDDSLLLRQYVEHCSGDAFAELVRRHVDAVYSSALRRANGDRAMAEDIAQCVFTDFARKAPQFPAGTVPGGWLHRHTGFVASHHIDRERRRRWREQQAAAMNALSDSAEDAEDAAWHRTAPLLDAALDSLPGPDRDAIVLRFFEKRDFRAVGHALGVNDDTAQKRVSRALEKLRGLLTRRGVTGTGAALPVIMLAHSVSSAPAALVSVLPGRALAGAAAAGRTVSAAVAGLGTAARWKLAGLAAVLAAAGAVPFLIFGEQAAPVRAPSSQTSSAASGTLAVAVPPAPAALPAPSVPQSVAEIIIAAAAELRGGAQNISATAKALALLTQIPSGKSREALGLVADVPDASARALLYKYILSHWAESEPRNALEFADKELPDQHRLAVSEGVLAAWAARDPESVFGWHQKSGIAPAPVRDSLMAAVFKNLASRDLPKAFLYLENVGSLNERAQALRGILDTVQTPQDRDQILRVIAGARDAEIRTQARRAVVETWARQDPAGAAAWVDQAEPAWERPRLMDSLSLMWLQSDPAAAAAWWIAREPGPDTLVKIINVWSQEDPNAAGKWLSTQPAGPQSDTARMTFARQVADLDPESALTWAATVSDETMRRATSGHILQSWRAREPQAAAQWESQHPSLTPN